MYVIIILFAYLGSLFISLHGYFIIVRCVFKTALYIGSYLKTQSG